MHATIATNRQLMFTAANVQLIHGQGAPHMLNQLPSRTDCCHRSCRVTHTAAPLPYCEELPINHQQLKPLIAWLAQVQGRAAPAGTQLLLLLQLLLWVLRLLRSALRSCG